MGRSRKRRAAAAASSRTADASGAERTQRDATRGRTADNASGGERMQPGEARPRAAAATSSEERMQRGYARGRAADDTARAKLVPLAPGERPRAITVAAVVAALIAVANVVFLLAGYDVRGNDPKPGGVLAFSGLMLVAAAGMWRRAYWAVLGFQALLGISIVISALSLLVASNLRAVAVAFAVMTLSGTLFWFLIRAMARLQMPQRKPRA